MPADKSCVLFIRVKPEVVKRIDAAAAQYFDDNRSALLRTAITLLLDDIDAGTYPPKPQPRTYAARRARVHAKREAASE